MDNELKRTLFEAATAFSFGEGVSIEMRNKDGDRTLWAVVSGRSTLNDEGYWEYEPMPSSRDEAYLARTRFTLEDAYVRMREALANPKTVD